jgi:hypothetical protein
MQRTFTRAALLIEQSATVQAPAASAQSVVSYIFDAYIYNSYI